MFSSLALALSTSVAQGGLTYVWNQNNQWSATDNWEAAGNWNGVVDLSQECVNSFNSEDSAGMAIGLDTDANAGTLKMPVNGKIVFGRKANNQPAKITLTGGSSGRKNWKCRPRISTSSVCPDNYKVFNGTTEVNTTQAPCYQDTVIIDLDVVGSMTWHPGHVIKRLIIGRGVSSSTGSVGQLVAAWPDNGQGQSGVGGMAGIQYDDWDETVQSRFAGNAPDVDARHCRSGNVCQLFCVNSCPKADITDPDIALQFGSNVTQQEIDDALDNAIQMRAALGRMQNILNSELASGNDYPGSNAPVRYALSDVVPAGTDLDALAEALEHPDHSALFLGWSFRSTDLTASPAELVLLRPPQQKPTSILDYNIAWHQAKYAIELLLENNNQITLPATGPVTVGTSNNVVVGTSEAAYIALSGDLTSAQSSAVGGSSQNARLMRQYVRNYLTNERAQLMCRYFRNETAFYQNEGATPDVEMGSIDEGAWTRTDSFNMTASDGTVHHSTASRNRRMPVNPNGEDCEQAMVRMVGAVNNVLMSAAAQGHENNIAIKPGNSPNAVGVASVRCGAAYFVDKADNFAAGACNFTRVELVPNQLQNQGVSLVSTEIYEAVIGLVSTQMSMHAVGVHLNQSILNTDAAWAAFTAESSEDEFPLLMVAGGAAILVVLCLLIAIIVVMSGGDGDGSKKDAARNVVAFENPMYDDPNRGGDAAYGGDEDPGLYDEPAFNAGADKENPAYASNEQVADGGGGYLDVEPDDGDDDDDDDDDDSDDDDDE
jgi:hypothetical protein